MVEAKGEGGQSGMLEPLPVSAVRLVGGSGYGCAGNDDVCMLLKVPGVLLVRNILA